MKIEKLTIKNFGIISEAEIDMSSKSGNLTFINGLNGRGKTTFQSAIRWCFYGDEPKSSSKFASRYALKKIQENDTIVVKASAEISLDKDAGTAFIERTQVFAKQVNGIPKKIGAPTLIVKTKSGALGALTDVTVDPDFWINEHFPKRLINFFLFDGELMVNFFHSNVKEEIEKAIREIAGVDLFEGAGSNLNILEVQLSRKIAKLTGPKAQSIEHDLQAEDRILAEILSEHNDKKEQLGKLRSRKSEVDGHLLNSGDSRELADRIFALDNDIAREEASLALQEKEFHWALVSGGVNSLLATSFTELYVQVNNAKRDDCLPPAFEPERIKELLDRGRCICGCDLTSGNSQSLELAALLEKHAVASDVGKIVDATARNAEKLAVKLNSDWATLNRINQGISNSKAAISKLKNEKDKISQKLQNSDISAIRALGREQTNLESEIYKLTTEVIRLEEQAKISMDRKERLDKQFREAAQGNKEADELRKFADFAQELAEAAKSIHKFAIKRVRENLENAVSEKFAIVKAGKFKTQITDDFEVLTLNEDGSKVELSEGENMAKAYIFSLALRDVINLGFPLIVDTPFGRLSGDFRAWLSDVLARFLVEEAGKSNRQIIFLMTDTEYTPYTKNRFAVANPLEFYLAYEKDNETDKSIVGLGIDPEWLKHDYWKDWAKGAIK